MLTQMVDHVIGIDPDRDWITVAVVEANTAGVVATERFGANRDGYDEAMGWADAYSTDVERAWVVEGTASYGRGITAALSRAGEWVLEFDRATTTATKDGAKTDELDAVRAAREALGRDRLAQPRRHDGHREAIRVRSVARTAAVRARTAAINELKALIVTAADELRSELRDLPRTRLVKVCVGFRHSPTRSQAEDQTRMALRALARRISHLNDEIADHDQAIEDLLSVAAPQLLTEPGVGPITAAAFYIAWSHPGRCRNEAAYARLAGVAPIPAISGQTSDRFRLNRGGDRQLNRAFYLVAVTRTRYDQRTKDYIARRISEGKTQREAIRCIKRYTARRTWRLLEHPPPTPS